MQFYENQFLQLNFPNWVQRFTVGVWTKSWTNSESVGTGTIFSHNNQQYILTCEHIATGFFSSSTTHAQIALTTTRRWEKTEVSLFAKCEVDDIALIKIENNPIETVNALTLENFDFIDDFTEKSFDKSDFILCGFPSAFVEAKGKNRPIRPLTFLTSKNKAPSKNELYLNYTEHSDSLNYSVFEGQPKAPVILDSAPNPHGLSGALIYHPTPSESKQVWQFGSCKFIAMQSEFSPKDQFLTAKPLCKIRQWLQGD